MSFANKLMPISVAKAKLSNLVNEITDGNEKIILRNNEPKAVLMSIDMYERLLEAEADLEALIIAHERMQNPDGKKYSIEEVMKELGITPNDFEE